MVRRSRWLRRTAFALAVVVGLGLVAALAGWLWLRAQFLDSGGPLRPLQAAYDVRRYDLEVAIDPTTRRIRGRNLATVVSTAPLPTFEIHLDGRLRVDAVRVDGEPARFRHRDGLIAVTLAPAWRSGERHAVEIVYGGKPKVAARPPWLDGLVWRETPAGAPWLGVTTQGDGADDWWPAKDHPSDEPDEGMSIALTLPSGLVGLANGRKTGEQSHGDGTTTTFWEVSYPINNYLVTFNAAPYVPIEEIYRGVDGTLEVPVVFWAIPEQVEEARKLWARTPEMLTVLGRRFGEYPFLDDKFWVAHAPYEGMEHQTLVAYGGDFTDNRFGFDDLMVHEVAHEWWGNKISVGDWADFWIQEGFATYAEAIFVLDTQGEEKYLEYMRGLARRNRNRKPIVAGRDLTSAQAYRGDIYSKGAGVLHTLKWLLGDEPFFTAIHRFATDERYAYRIVSGADFEALVAEIAGTELPWFWARYLRRAELPAYSVERAPSGQGRERVSFAWDEPGFELPLPVRLDGAELRVEMPAGRGELEVAAGAPLEVDPFGRVLARPAARR